MARQYLGDTLDIHTGGEDNAFPHHECEIAQSEALTGKPFSRFWLHTRFLLVDGAKMAKSSGTMYVLEDVEKHLGAEGDPEKERRARRALRYYLLSAHYRAPMNFTFDALGAATDSVAGLDAMARRIEATPGAADVPGLADACARADGAFLAALEDDLNISSALAAVYELRGVLNKVPAFSAADVACAWATLDRIDSVLGLDLRAAARPVALGDADIARLIDERNAARKSRDFARADQIRKDLLAKGIVLEDTPQGVKWRRA
jgi:cysteinyl-tRNA synthetase